VNWRDVLAATAGRTPTNGWAMPSDVGGRWGVRLSDEVIESLTVALRDCHEQLREAVDVMRECPNCSQHVHRKGETSTTGGESRRIVGGPGDNS
jgi:hypothetical protein